MEAVTGAGIAEMFKGLSWGACNPVCGFSSQNSGFGGAAFGQTNIDAGLAAVSAAEMTCPESTPPTATEIAFYGGGVRTAANIYTRESTHYGYLYRHFTKEIRSELEPNWFRTTYADGVNAENRRAQLTMFYRC